MKRQHRKTRFAQTAWTVVWWISLLISVEVSTLVRLSVHLMRRSSASLIVEKKVDGMVLEDVGTNTRALNQSLSQPLAKEQGLRCHKVSFEDCTHVVGPGSAPGDVVAFLDNSVKEIGVCS